jgi:hypothetical protein
MPEGRRQRARCVGYQQISGLNAAKGFTLPSVDPVTGEKCSPTMAIVTPQTQAVRWRSDGTDPSATVGMPLAVGAFHTFEAEDLARAKFFEQAASAVLNVEYYESDA